MNIMTIGAHSDDIEISCGGTITKAVKRGDDVIMVVLTRSAYDNYSGNVLRTAYEAKSEGEEAAKILGVNDLIWLDFPTKDVPYSSKSIEALNSLMDKFNPDIIITHWVYDTHPSHRNTGLATISAARWFNSILMYEPMMPSGRSYQGFRPQVYIDITDFNETKIKSLKAHCSQHTKYGNMWLEAVSARAKHRGYEMGVQYAESYEVMRLELFK